MKKTQPFLSEARTWHKFQCWALLVIAGALLGLVLGGGIK